MATKKKSTKKKPNKVKTSSKKKAPKKKRTKAVKKKTSSKTKVRKNIKTKAKTKAKAKKKTKAKTKAKAKTKTKVKKKIKAKAKTKTKTKAMAKAKISRPSVAKQKKIRLNSATFKIRQQLVINQQELLNIIQVNQSAERNTTESNFSNEIDMASDLEGREMMFQLTSRDRSELKMIQEAIYKIDHGTYGICEGCSKNISAKRLKILPLSSLCIECKEAMEQV